MYNTEGLDPPDPGRKLARLLAWIKKRGGIVTFKKCEVKASQIEIDGVKDKIKDVENFKVRMGRLPSGDKEIAICIVDKGWADGWEKYYDVEIPHHRHMKKL